MDRGGVRGTTVRRTVGGTREFARFAVPLRVGLALSTTPWVDENIVSRFVSDSGDDEGS